jgi:hypothetical protein
MAVLAQQTRRVRINPLDLVEELIGAHDWSINRHSDNELMIEATGRWCGYQMYFLWQRDMDALFFTCQLDQRIPPDKCSAVKELLVSVNEGLWIGHFDLIADEAAPIYRYSMPLRGAPGLSVEQLEDVIDSAFTACERFYPALQLVVWGGRKVADAISLARMDPVGEA